jgi:hypothetical protein
VRVNYPSHAKRKVGVEPWPEQRSGSLAIQNERTAEMRGVV